MENDTEMSEKERDELKELERESLKALVQEANSNESVRKDEEELE